MPERRVVVSLAEDHPIGKKNATWRILLVPFGVIAGVWACYWWLIANYLESWTERGTFGDAFGALNTLFAGLAFAGVICAIYLQGRELRLQREELEQTREQLRRSAEAQEQTHATLRLQTRLSAMSALVAADAALYEKLSPRSSASEGMSIRIQKQRQQLEDLLKSFDDNESSPDVA